MKVLVATDDAVQAEEAKKAGAEIVVDKAQLTEILKSEKFDFEIMVADPKNDAYFRKIW